MPETKVIPRLAVAAAMLPLVLSVSALRSQDAFGPLPELPVDSEGDTAGPFEDVRPQDDADGEPGPSVTVGDEARDAIDASGPHNADLAKLLRRAEALLAKGQWEKAQETLLFVAGEADGTLVRLSDGSMVSAAEVANRLLGTMPSEVLELYRRQFGGAAEKALQEAVASGRQEELERVATLFRHTSAGREAVERLASLHFDRAEFGLAARRYRELLGDGGRFTPRLRLKAATAFRKAGDEAAARRLITGLSDAERALLAGSPAGGGVLKPQANPVSASEASLALDWRMPFGDPSRSAVAVPGEPVLLRRWFRPLTDRANVAEQAARVTAELRDAERATVPAAIPLAIGDRIFARTFRGVDAYSAATGRLLWETTEGLSPERELAGDGGPTVEPEARRILRFRGQFGPDPSRGGPGEQDGVTSLLYRDGVGGFLSADSERLYVVEDSASFGRPQSVMGFEGQDEDPLGRDRSSNRLGAYDLETGRPVWAGQGGIGGTRSGAASDRPLAGTFFFGPPTPVGDELYVIGERANQRGREIRLFALDPATGHPLWDRLIANPPIGIDQDPVRRWWPAQVAVDDGVIVCPTTVGWLVGVDAASQAILWAYRYAPVEPARGEDDGGLPATPSSLNSRWSPSAPVIRHGRVVFTPSEATHLVCLDLATGRLAWQQGKGSALYVAGVAGDVIVTVGTAAVTGLDLRTGTTLWTVNADRDAGLPSGRAAMSSDRLYLPLGGDSLRTIDVKSGAVVGELPLPSGDGSLGNLLLHRGTLLSYAADGLTAFEERAGLTRIVEDRLNADPADPVALLRRADLQAADGDLESAAETLDRIDSDRVPVDRRTESRRLRVRVLTQLAEAGGDNAGRRLDELARLAETPEERLAVRRLEADLAFAAADAGRAITACFALLDEKSPTRLVSDEDGRVKVRLDAWLAGRFGELWANADEPSRAAITRGVEARIAAVRDQAERSRLARVFGFHPRAAAIIREEALEQLAAGRLAEAETGLIPLTRRDDTLGEKARSDLAEAARKLGFAADAAVWAGGAATASGEEASEGMGPAASWGEFRLAVGRSGSYQTGEVAVELRPDAAAAPLPSVLHRQFRLQPQQDRLAVSGLGGAGLDALIPLRVGPRSAPSAGAIADGHLLFLFYRNVAQLISPVEGRVVWATLAGDDPAGAFNPQAAPQPMRPAGSVAASGGLIARARLRNPMPAANAGYVALRGRRELTVLDSDTGSLRWTRSDVPPDAAIVGTESLLYVVPRDRGEAFAVRAVDGHRVERPEAVRRIRYAVTAVGDRLLTVTAEQDFSFLNLRLGRSVVALHDPETGKPVWSRVYPQDALFDLAADGRLCVLEPEGKLSALDGETGRPSLLGTVPAEVLGRRNETYLLGDDGGAYLVVNSGRGAATYYPADIPAIPVHGELFAFDTAGATKWRREVASRRLLCQEFNHSPVLLFADSEMTEKAERTFWRVDLLALDKRTGEPVLDEPYHSQSTPFFRGLAVQPERRSIELSAYPVRLRLQAVPKAPEPPVAGSAAD